MTSTKSLTIVLPSALAESVEAKVASGAYANESDVVQDSLGMLLAQDAEVEDWLRNDVTAAYDRYKQDPSRAVPAEDVQSRLEQRFAADLEATERGA